MVELLSPISCIDLGFLCLGYPDEAYKSHWLQAMVSTKIVSELTTIFKGTIAVTSKPDEKPYLICDIWSLTRAIRRLSSQHSERISF